MLLTNMVMVPVKSSNVAKIGYLATERTLGVQYHDGSLYYYYTVPQSVRDGLMAATSKGSYIHQNIKGKYGFAQIS